MDLKLSTVTDYRRKLVVFCDALGTKRVKDIRTADLAGFLDRFPAPQRNAYRSLLVQVFRYGQNLGWLDSNPAAPTFRQKHKVKRRRLTIDGFWAVYSACGTYMQRAMLLALRTLQRREDLTNLKRADIRDGFLYVLQGKTGQAIKIAIDETLAKDLADCTGDDKFILHRAGRKLDPNWLTTGFSKARDKCGYFDDMPVDERPTFHEIRALGAMLYLKAGRSVGEIQRLLGHRTEEMTRLYLSRHGIEWTEAGTSAFADHIEVVLHGRNNDTISESKAI